VPGIGLLTSLVNLEVLNVGWKGAGMYVDITPLGAGPIISINDLQVVSTCLSKLRSLSISSRRIGDTLFGPYAKGLPELTVLPLGWAWATTLKKVPNLEFDD